MQLVQLVDDETQVWHWELHSEQVDPFRKKPLTHRVQVLAAVHLGQFQGQGEQVAVAK